MVVKRKTREARRGLRLKTREGDQPTQKEAEMAAERSRLPMLLVLLLLLGGFWAVADSDEGLATMSAFVPEVLPAVPTSPMAVSFGDAKMEWGTAVTPSASRAPPSVSWSPNDDALYTLVITNPDIPTMEKHVYGELVHWMVVNVLKGDVTSGDTLFEYLSPGAPKGTGQHRYLLLAFRQAAVLDVESETKVNATTLDGRFHFSIQDFAKSHDLEMPPVAGNFFLSEWDEFVEELREIRVFKGQKVSSLKP